MLKFTTGNPKGSLVRGSLQLSTELSGALRLSFLKVPTYMTAADLCYFLRPFEDRIGCIWLLRDVEEKNSYDVLLSFVDADSSALFAEEYNGKVFSSLGGEICSLLAATSVELEDDNLKIGTHHEDSEQCPVCLENLGAGGITSNFAASLLDANIVDTHGGPASSSQRGHQPRGTDAAVHAGVGGTGAEPKALIVTLCGHAMHIHCLAQWGDNSCPVCRYSLEPSPESSTCQQCDTDESLWMCLICGHVGCGRNVNKHALQHFQSTSHTFSLEIVSGKVWDYAGDNFVHRLVVESSEGKIVEVSPGRSATFQQEAHEVHTEHRSQELEVIESYNRQVKIELDTQRRQYEKRLKDLEAKWEQRVEALKLQLEQEEELGQIARASEYRARAANDQLRERLKDLEDQTKTTTFKVSRYRQLHDKLSTDLDVWKSQLHDLEVKIKDAGLEAARVQEEIRDVSLHLQTLENLESTSAPSENTSVSSSTATSRTRDVGVASEIAGGDILGVASTQRRRRQHRQK